jgi:hypothetical protein
VEKKGNRAHTRREKEKSRRVEKRKGEFRKGERKGREFKECKDKV